jgi:hypothetical protein
VNDRRRRTCAGHGLPTCEVKKSRVALGKKCLVVPGTMALPRDGHADAGIALHRIDDERKLSIRMNAKKDIGGYQERVRRRTRIFRRHPSQQWTRRRSVIARHLTPSSHKKDQTEM